MTSGGRTARGADAAKSHRHGKALVEALEARTLLDALPDLTASVEQVSLPAVVLPGDLAQAKVLVTNAGAAAAKGSTTLQVQLVGGATAIIGQATVSLNIAAGASQEYIVRLSIPPSAQAGDYGVQAVIDPQNTIAETSNANNVSDTFGATTVAWRFGTFDGRKNVKLTVLDSGGKPVTFAMSGPGSGEVQGGPAFGKIVLDQTTVTSSLMITAVSSAVGQIVSAGPLKSITGKGIDLKGGAILSGGVTSIAFDDTSGDQNIIIGASLNPKAAVSFSFHQVHDLSIASAMPIKSIKATEWRDTGGAFESITAPSVGSLVISGDAKAGISGNFEASLALGDVLQPVRISNGGTIVGNYVGLNLQPQGFVFAGGHVCVLDTFGGPHSMVVGMNNSGLVVGQADTSGLDAGGRPLGHAFVSNGTAMQDLGTLGGANSTAYDVNGSGLVVGESEIDSLDTLGNPITHAFSWIGGTMTDLGVLCCVSSEATAVNSAGVIVGRTLSLTGDGQNVTRASHAFWWQDGVMSALPTLGGPESVAVDVNDSGLAVGWADTDLLSGTDPLAHAVLWQNGQAQDLGTLGGTRSAASAINNAGQVVGWSETGYLDHNGRPIMHAFVWQGGQMIDLGVEVAGDESASACISINDNGQIVGYTPQGAFRIDAGQVASLKIPRSGVANPQPLKSAMIGGSVGYSAWQVAGSAGAVTIKGGAIHWRLYASDNIKSVKMAVGVNSAVSAGGALGSVTTMKWANGRLGGGTIGSIKCTGNAKLGIAGDMTGDVQAAGNVGKLTVAGKASGIWDANAIASATVGGTMADMTVRLRQGVADKALALGKLAVTGAITNTSVLSAGSIGSVCSTGITASAIYAGVNCRATFADANDDGVEDLLDPAAFAAGAAIKSVKISRVAGAAYSVTNTNIGAAQLGTVTLFDAKLDNAGTPFGVSAGTIKSIIYADTTHHYTWPSGTVGAPQEGDFVVRVV